ncbi:MAG: effector binding domain-containing protein [Saprospiraceae bacterium]|nr:effector binding domain-containing protein [Saprospiraceae bacterium]
MDTQIEGFNIIGIKTRTQNDGKAAVDIPMLWGKFMDENIKEKIPNKIGDEIYCLYTGYDGDHLAPYDVIIGCKVSSIEELPEGMIAHVIHPGKVAKYVAKGSLIKGEAVINTWFKIWESKLDRSFQTDYEVYDERSQDIENAEVDIFVSLN